jgi:hypothetical protein
LPSNLAGAQIIVYQHKPVQINECTGLALAGLMKQKISGNNATLKLDLNQ